MSPARVPLEPVSPCSPLAMRTRICLEWPLVSTHSLMHVFTITILCCLMIVFMSVLMIVYIARFEVFEFASNLGSS